MDLHQILVIGHVLGAVLGLGGAVIAEAQIMKALSDNKISDDERALMHANYFWIRVGTALIILTGISLVWLLLNDGMTWVLKSAVLQVKVIMTAVIITNAVLLTKRLIPLWVGSALSLASWLGATILGASGGLPYSFTVLLSSYIVFIALVAIALHFIRKIYLRSS